MNYEEQRIYVITVRSYDNGSPALYVDQVFTIRVIDVNERPSALNTTTMYINENSPLNTFIGVMVGIDPDNFRQSGRQTLKYSLIGSANGLFKLDQDILRVSSLFVLSLLKVLQKPIRPLDGNGSKDLNAKQMYSEKCCTSAVYMESGRYSGRLLFGAFTVLVQTITTKVVLNQT